ncbi:MAG: hypothetical protein ACUVT7_05590 [Thermoplasmata archaeon]
MIPKSFAFHCLELQRLSTQVLEPCYGVEVRRLRNGVLVFIDHFERHMLVRFPESQDWVDFKVVKKARCLEDVKCKPLTSFPELKLSEINKLLENTRKSAE